VEETPELQLGTSMLSPHSMIDKIVISPSGQRPKDKGPVESPRGGGNTVSGELQ
jgi:hypothetical protein